MTHERCADLAELYALGALDDAERAEVEEHLSECKICMQLIGVAERDVALIASMEPQREAPHALARRIESSLGVRRAWRLPAALAAALLVGLLPSIYFWSENRALHGAMRAQSAAMERLANTPHQTAHFRSAPGAPPAEVTYAPDGSWYLVVVRATSKRFGVAWMHDGRRTMLGDAVPRGDVAMLYLPRSHRMDRLALMDGGRVVAEATLSWQKKAPNRPGGRSG